MAFIRYTRNCFLVFILSITFQNCSQEEELKVTSSQAQAYLNELVGYMRKYSVNLKTIDWDKFIILVNEKARGAQSIADTYPAIELALTLLGDNHSKYTPVSGGVTLYGKRTVSCTATEKVTLPSNSRVGYIKLDPSGGVDARGVKYGSWGVEYAQAVQDAIRAADTGNLRGWIVDLRGNTGGELYGMLAGIGPILGEGITGYFDYPGGEQISWGYEKGAGFTEEGYAVTITAPYSLKKPNPKVAVLTDQATASAGEGIAIAFKGRPHTQSFGAPSCGVSTSVGSIKMSDGGYLALTIATMADRNRKVYGKSVQPDQFLAGSRVVDEAINWLIQE